MGVAVRELGGPHYLGRIGLPGAAVLADVLVGAVTLAVLTGCSDATASPGVSASVAEPAAGITAAGPAVSDSDGAPSAASYGVVRARHRERLPVTERVLGPEHPDT
jgi:uncharacterized protein YcfL